MSRAKIIDVTNGTNEQFRKLCFLMNYEINNLWQMIEINFPVFQKEHFDKMLFLENLVSNKCLFIE